MVTEIKFFGNNEMSITLTKNTKSQHQIKYIDIQYDYIRELINKIKLGVKWISRSKMLADEMTKALSLEIF